jgi:hypothetical protein
MRHMKNRVVLVGALLASTGLIAMAQGIDGKWTAETQGRGGAAVTQTLTLKSSGMNLTGSLDGGQGMPADISEGMIHDTDVTFKVVREFNGNKVTTTYKGTLSGDDLKLTATREAPAGGGAPGGGGGGGGKGGGGGRGGPQELAFKRAK